MAKRFAKLANISVQDASKFIRALMRRATAENNGSQKAQQFLRFNSSKLNDSLLEKLPLVLTKLIDDKSPNERLNTVESFVALGGFLQQFPFVRQEIELELSTVILQFALSFLTREAFPDKWAEICNCLGIAYSNRIREDQAKNIEEAITAYDLALQVYSKETFPESWAAVQNNRGIALVKRIRGERTKNIEEAITAYDLALQVYSKETFPESWAAVQNNRGNAYINRIEGTKAKNIEKAITAYQLALQIYTRKAFPQDWATVQNNLGNVYRDSLIGNKTDNLERAISAYKLALTVRSREVFPQDWAQTQSNLAAALVKRALLTNNSVESSIQEDGQTDFTWSNTEQDSLFSQNVTDSHDDHDQLISVENVIDSDEDDTIQGDEQAAIIISNYGDDDIKVRVSKGQITDRDGDDSLKGGGDDDLLEDGLGDDSLYGEDGAYIIKGGYGNNSLKGGADEDILYGDDGYDYLEGGTEDDLLDGGRGDDILYGSTGHDELYGGDGDDFLNGGDGTDLIDGGNGSDTLLNIDNIIASNHDDVVLGNNFNEQIDNNEQVDNKANVNEASLTDLDAAILLLQEALEVLDSGSPNFIDSQYRLGNALSRRYERNQNSEDLEQALQAYQIALDAINPEHYDRSQIWQALPTTQSILGSRLVRDGQWQEGLKLLLNSVEQLRTGDDILAHANALFQTGYAHETLSDWEQARLYYRDALRLYDHVKDQPGIAQSRAGLGSVLVSQGSLPKGIAELEKAIEVYRQLKRLDRVAELENLYKVAHRALERQASGVYA